MKITFSILVFSFLGFTILSAQDSIVERLPAPINTNHNEILPMPFGVDILYYSSDFNKTTKIYRTEKKGGSWKEPLEPAIFDDMEKEHFQGGSFTPNKSRFYFSQCDIIDGKERCEIYVMQRNDQDWSKPKKLPEFINKIGCTTSDPFVHVIDGEEILYFSSDRVNGIGGQDIWFTTKDDNTEDLNFSEPINLGKVINTAGDEISPYYDRRERILYFSSNGQKKNIGNLDIYETEGTKAKWSKPTLLNAPINSKYDDAYFRLNGQNFSGYFSSNRLDTARTTNQKDYDLYHLKVYQKQLEISGKIYDKRNTQELVVNAMVRLYEVTNTGEYALTSNISPDGYYSFYIRPNRRYKIELEKNDYVDTTFYFQTDEEKNLVQNLALEKIIKVKIRGKIHKKGNPKVLINNTSFHLIEVTSTSQRVFISNILSDSDYSIELRINHKYILELSRNGYHDTIFHFHVTEEQNIIQDLVLEEIIKVEVKGKILNKENLSEKLTNIKVELYERDNTIRLQQHVFAAEGDYSFKVEPYKTYLIKLKRGNTFIKEHEFKVTEKDVVDGINIDFLVNTFYEVKLKEKEFKLSGIIHNARNVDVLLEDVNIIVAELTADDRLIFVREGFFSSNYIIELNSTKNYKISLSRDGYFSISYLVLGSMSAKSNIVTMDLYMFPK